MALVKRISQLFTADAHAVLDMIEDPLTLLKQAIRDMEAAIQTQQKKLSIEKNKLSQHESKQTKAQQELSLIDNDLDLCFDEKNETLARSLVKKKIFIKRVLQNLKEAIERTQETIANQSKQLQTNQARFESMQQQAELLANQQSEIDAQSNFDSFNNVSEEEIEIALLNEKKSRSGS